MNLPHMETIQQLEEVSPRVYCTGPGVSRPHEAYDDDSIDDPAVRATLRSFCLVDAAGCDVTPDVTTQAAIPASGNITVDCFADGSCRVETEL